MKPVVIWLAVCGLASALPHKDLNKEEVPTQIESDIRRLVPKLPHTIKHDPHQTSHENHSEHFDIINDTVDITEPSYIIGDKNSRRRYRVKLKKKTDSRSNEEVASTDGKNTYRLHEENESPSYSSSSEERPKMSYIMKGVSQNRNGYNFGSGEKESSEYSQEMKFNKSASRPKQKMRITTHRTTVTKRKRLHKNKNKDVVDSAENPDFLRNICQTLNIKPNDVWLLANQYLDLDIYKPEDLKKLKDAYQDFISDFKNNPDNGSNVSSFKAWLESNPKYIFRNKVNSFSTVTSELNDVSNEDDEIIKEHSPETSILDLIKTKTSFSTKKLQSEGDVTSENIQEPEHDEESKSTHQYLDVRNEPNPTKKTLSAEEWLRSNSNKNDPKFQYRVTPSNSNNSEDLETLKNIYQDFKTSVKEGHEISSDIPSFEEWLRTNSKYNNGNIVKYEVTSEIINDYKDLEKVEDQLHDFIENGKNNSDDGTENLTVEVSSVRSYNPQHISLSLGTDTVNGDVKENLRATLLNPSGHLDVNTNNADKNDDNSDNITTKESKVSGSSESESIQIDNSDEIPLQNTVNENYDNSDIESVMHSNDISTPVDANDDSHKNTSEETQHDKIKINDIGNFNTLKENDLERNEEDKSRKKINDNRDPKIDFISSEKSYLWPGINQVIVEPKNPFKGKQKKVEVIPLTSSSEKVSNLSADRDFLVDYKDLISSGKRLGGLLKDEADMFKMVPHGAEPNRLGINDNFNENLITKGENNNKDHIKVTSLSKGSTENVEEDPTDKVDIEQQRINDLKMHDSDSSYDLLEQHLLKPLRINAEGQLPEINTLDDANATYLLNEHLPIMIRKLALLNPDKNRDTIYKELLIKLMELYPSLKTVVTKKIDELEKERHLNAGVNNPSDTHATDKSKGKNKFQHWDWSMFEEPEQQKLVKYNNPVSISETIEELQVPPVPPPKKTTKLTDTKTNLKDMTLEEFITLLTPDLILESNRDVFKKQRNKNDHDPHQHVFGENLRNDDNTLKDRISISPGDEPWYHIMSSLAKGKDKKYAILIPTSIVSDKHRIKTTPLHDFMLRTQKGPNKKYNKAYKLDDLNLEKSNENPSIVNGRPNVKNNKIHYNFEESFGNGINDDIDARIKQMRDIIPKTPSEEEMASWKHLKPKNSISQSFDSVLDIPKPDILYYFQQLANDILSKTSLRIAKYLASEDVPVSNIKTVINRINSEMVTQFSIGSTKCPSDDLDMFVEMLKLKIKQYALETSGLRDYV